MDIRKYGFKIIILGLIAVLFFSVFAAVGSNFATAQEAENRDLRVYVDGEQVNFPDQEPYIDSNDRTLVPVRFVSQALGARVDWENITKKVTVTDPARGIEIILWVGNRDYEINGVKKHMDTEAILTGQSRVMVPLRFLSEGLGSYVDYRTVEKVGLVFSFSHDFPGEEIAETVSRIVRDVETEHLENEAFRNIKVSGFQGNYTITGEARVYEGTVQYEVSDGHIVFAKNFVTASSGGPDWGTFSIEVNIAKDDLPEYGTLIVFLFEESAKDGSIINELPIVLEIFNKD
jgi:hypothetical protein